MGYFMKELSNQLVCEKRHGGIDLLKVLAMLMVVMLHVNGHGGLLSGASLYSVHWFLINVIEFLCIGAVNIFALASGYVNYGRKVKVKNILTLWLQVFFYSFFITLIFYFTNWQGKVSLLDILKSAFPVASERYWFFSAYFLLFFTMPILNIVLDKLSKKQALLGIGIFLVLCTVIGYVYDAFNIEDGYSAVWLMVLYFIGAYVKKYGFSISIKGKEIKPILYLVFYFVCSLLSVACVVFRKEILNKPEGYTYTFILHFLSALFIFLFFSKANIKCSKLLLNLSKVSFSVYIITEQPFIRSALFTGKYVGLLNYNPLITVLAILLIAVVMYLACFIIENLRLFLFKLIKVDKFTGFVQKKTDGFIEKLK